MTPVLDSAAFLESLFDFWVMLFDSANKMKRAGAVRL
jgi:hypothetical protein